LTFIEIIVGAGLFLLFLACLLWFYRGGQQAGAQTLWLQETGGRLQNAGRQMAETIGRSSYPTTFVFPGTIVENRSDDFKVFLAADTRFFATASLPLARGGTTFLRFTQATPERQGTGSDTPPILVYHLYSLTAEGHLYYRRFEERPGPTAAPDYARQLRRPAIPPPDARPLDQRSLVDDVESLAASVSGTASRASLLVEVTCRWPKGQTRRTETFVLISNTGLLVRRDGGS